MALSICLTDRPDLSRRSDNFPYNQNSPARSVKSWIVSTKEKVPQQKLLEKPISFSNWLVEQWQSNGPADQFCQMESALT